MEIRKLFNITEEEIWKNNILVPICVWNRFFLNDTKLTQNLVDYIIRALERTKEKVLVVVADEIQISNWIVRNSAHSVEQNKRRLARKWVEIKNNIQNIIDNLPEEQQKNIEVIWWREYAENDPFCKKTTDIIYKEFENNPSFKNEVLRAIKTSIDDREFSEEEYLTLCRYVLDEFSIVYHGPTYKDIFYWLMIYPYTDEVEQMFEKIKIGSLLPELKNKLNSQQSSVAFLN